MAFSAFVRLSVQYRFTRSMCKLELAPCDRHCCTGIRAHDSTGIGSASFLLNCQFVLRAVLKDHHHVSAYNNESTMFLQYILVA